MRGSPGKLPPDLGRARSHPKPKRPLEGHSSLAETLLWDGGLRNAFQFTFRVDTFSNSP